MAHDKYLPLRERLRQADPALAADLDLQWRIANEEWLPTIPMSKDSANGLPHIRNIENHLDETLSSLHVVNPSAAVLHMRPIENYLLLASILFHDLGRADPSGGEEHEIRTRRYIENKYTSLGIRNREVARSLASVCARHTKNTVLDKPEIGTGLREEKQELPDVVIDPHGEVRQRTIASLLTLGDLMDSSHSRAVPDYLRESKDVIGSFRDIVQGIFADPAARLVRTVLIPPDEEEAPSRPRKDGLPSEGAGEVQLLELNEDSKNKEWAGWAKMLARALTARAESVEKNEKNVIASLNKAFSEDTTCSTDAQTPTKRRGLTRGNIEEADSLSALRTALEKKFGRLDENAGSTKGEFLEHLLAWNMVRIKRATSEDSDRSAPLPSLPRKTLLAIVLGDLRRNRIALRSVRDHLAAVGLPLATWLVDYRERLYTAYWRETYEPVFHKEYLTDVAKAMWDLSRRVIGTSEFTFAELASYLGDYDVTRVRLAARRLAIVVTANTSASRANLLPWPCPIWVGDDTWKWRAKLRRPEDGGCQFFPLKEATSCLSGEKLVDPYDPQELD